MGLCVTVLAGCAVKAAEVDVAEPQLGTTHQVESLLTEDFTADGKPTKTIETPWGHIDIDVISKAPVSYFEGFSPKFSKAQMQAILNELNEYESAEEAYESQVLSFVSQGCKRVHHYTGPINIISEIEAKIANPICLKPYEGLIDEHCKVLGQATIVPEPTTVLCTFQGKINEFTPYALMKMDRTEFDPFCALKSRAVVAYTKCLDK